ncbi:unnamed protein product [Closterium sp. NIES-53]
MPTSYLASLWTPLAGCSTIRSPTSSSLLRTFNESVCYYRSRPHRGGADAEGEGTAGAGGVDSGGTGAVGVEVTPLEDTAASSRRPRPASPPGFPSVPQFPPRSSLRPVAAEPGGVPTRGSGGPRGVSGGGAGSRGAGAGGTCYSLEST